MFKVFNQRLAGFLMQHGFKLLAIEPNQNISDFNVFVFEKTDSLLITIGQYQNTNNHQ